MQVYESKDCLNDVDSRMTTFCRFHYADKRDPKTTIETASMMGCQKSNHDEPSSDTMRTMKAIAAKNTGLDADNVVVRTSCHALGAWGSELTTDELMSKKMTSNCAPTFSLNEVTGYVSFSCRYTGQAPGESGKLGSNANRVWSGQLATCSRAGDADQQESDVKKVAQRMMGGLEGGIDISKIQCTTTELPRP